MKFINLARKYKKQVLISVGGSLAVFGGMAQAALVQLDVDAIVAAVIADAGIAVAAGMAILTVVLGAHAGFGLLQKFVKKGAH